MKPLYLLLAGVVAVLAIGCGSGSGDTVDVPKSATEGGNSVHDPRLTGGTTPGTTPGGAPGGGGAPAPSSGLGGG